MDIQIEKGIPIPAKRPSDNIKAFIRLMEVGDSIIWPAHYTQGDQAIRSNCRAAGIGVSVQQQKDGTYRVWRTR